MGLPTLDSVKTYKTHREGGNCHNLQASRETQRLDEVQKKLCESQKGAIRAKIIR
jgi:hypothetical protein